MTPSKIRCLIVDDDPMSIALLESFVKKTDFLELTHSCNSGIDASNFLKKESVDLVFLDIEMPEMTGFQFIESLKNKPEIVLVTSKEEYAIDAFEQDVLDYIVKPPAYLRFLKAAKKAMEKFAARGEIKVEKNQLFVKAGSKLVPIGFDDISYIEANADYVSIYTAEKKLTVYSTMKGIHSKLPEEFLRVHRSYIINKSKITSIEDNLVAINEKLIPIGVTYHDELMKQLNLL